MRTDKDVIVLMTQDHDTVKALFDDAANRDEASQHQVYRRARALLDAHLHAEETTIYPTLDRDKGGETLRRNYLSDHAKIREILTVLDAIQPDHREWRTYLGALKSHVLEHILREERQLFPRLRNELTEDGLLDLAGKFINARERYQAPAAA